MDKIVLSAPIIETLYKHSLVELPAEGSLPVLEESTGETQQKSGDKKLIYRGENKKKISLIVSCDKEEPSEEQLVFIGNLLKACKLSLSDVAVLPSSQPISIKELKKELNPEVLIAFGLNPVNIGLPINFPEFKIQLYDGVSYLHTPGLEDINQEGDQGKLLKSKLWICLKQLFNL